MDILNDYLTFYVYDALDTMMLPKEKQNKTQDMVFIIKWFGIKKNTKIVIRFSLSPLSLSLILGEIQTKPQRFVCLFFF